MTETAPTTGISGGPADPAGGAAEEAVKGPNDGVAAHGERLAVPERVIISPAAGRFRPVEASEAADAEGGIAEEQVIGFVEGHGESTPVRSPFRGRLQGMLAHAGERVREGQPVAWMRLA
jgi:biotin carboxyl carrier protein